MGSPIEAIITGVFSGSVVATVVGAIFARRTKRIEQQIRTEFDERLDVSRSTRLWKEHSVAELLGPVFLQFERTERAFSRLVPNSVYLEAKIIKDANTVIRDLLLQKTHLIPPELLDDAAKLIEHYDRWLEEFEAVRGGTEPALNQPFVFVAPKGFPFRPIRKSGLKRNFRHFGGNCTAPKVGQLAGKAQLSQNRTFRGHSKAG
jgi:hypothetical protein